MASFIGNGSGGGRGGGLGGEGGGGGDSVGSGGVSSAAASAQWRPHGTVPVMPKAAVTSGPAQPRSSPLRDAETLHGVLPGAQSPPPFDRSTDTTPLRLVATPSSLREAPMLVPIAQAPQLVPLNALESSTLAQTAPPAVVFIATPEQGWPNHSTSRLVDRVRPPHLHLDAGPSVVAVETTNAVSVCPS